MMELPTGFNIRFTNSVIESLFSFSIFNLQSSIIFNFQFSILNFRLATLKPV